MSRAFSSWHDFFAMGGYAFYVWLVCRANADLPDCCLVVHTRLAAPHHSEIRRVRPRETHYQASRLKNAWRTETALVTGHVRRTLL